MGRREWMSRVKKAREEKKAKKQAKKQTKKMGPEEEAERKKKLEWFTPDRMDALEEINKRTGLFKHGKMTVRELTPEILDKLEEIDKRTGLFKHMSKAEEQKVKEELVSKIGEDVVSRELKKRMEKMSDEDLIKFLKKMKEEKLR